MRRYVAVPVAAGYFLLAMFSTGAYSQSLTDKLAEEDKFYVNYGKDMYAKLKIEKDIVGLYDFFGEHIVDGVNLYELSNEARTLSNDNVTDSVETSRSMEYQKNDFWEKFSNLVITQDAIGGIKTSFLIGDQITTRFTPLTFNKTNFRGIRWDVWSSGLQFSLIMSRTRPGFVSKKYETGTSLVEYPITEESIPDAYYNAGIAGNLDYSDKSPYGDYDFLWAVHAENNIANKVDIGLTYINHHVSDVKRGPDPFTGDLPDSLMPEHVHFEFYDLTPADTLDAGVYVRDVVMYVNGREVAARSAYRTQFRRAFVGDRDNVLLPRDLPLARAQNGHIPVIVEFKIDPKYWQYVDGGGSEYSLSRIRNLKFKYTVAGNYLVFVSTDRQIPLCIKGTKNPQTRLVEYSYPKKPVGDIYDEGLKISESGTVIHAPVEKDFSTTYFGEYIAQSSRKISVNLEKFDDAIVDANEGGNVAALSPYNYRTLEYEYNLNVSSITYALNFRGELFGIKFSGELALNQKEDKLPGPEGDRSRTNKFSGILKAERSLGKLFGINGEVYYVAPQWMTNLEDLQASQYFNQTSYKQEVVINEETGQRYPAAYPDYLIYPKPLDHSWQNIDDNDDGDRYVENDVRRYPSEFDADGGRYNFTKDGRLKWSSNEIKSVRLPNNMLISYDDPDGVVASKNDRNKNGIPDYLEDFLLFASDPPVFELGNDLNNNGIPDDEDDDLLPDFFGEPGRSVGAVITGDGIKTLGVQGFNLNFRWTPFANTNVDVGGFLESVVDRDLVLGVDDEDLEWDEGFSRVLYLMAQRQIIKRSQGLQYNLGFEFRKIWDAIRNDVIVSNIKRIAAEEIDVHYHYWEDRLDYRNSIVTNLLGDVVYTNIKDFEGGVKLKGGFEKHFGDTSLIYTPYDYDTKWQRYMDRMVFDAHAVGKLMYRLKFNLDYEDWRSILTFMNRLEIIPQYKVGFSWRKAFDDNGAGYEEQADPRNIRKHTEMDINNDGLVNYLDYALGTDPDSVEAVQTRWREYARNNYSYFVNVPILRANFKIAENTELQTGCQWLRYYDLVSPESNMSKFTVLAQIVAKSQYKGYNVIFFLGGRWYTMNYDVIAPDAPLGNGSLFNRQGYEFFAKLFSGI